MSEPQRIETVEGDAELERLRGGLFNLAEEAAAQEECGKTSQIWAGAQGQLSPQELRELLDYVVSCPNCVEEWRLAHSLGRPSDGVRRPRRAAASRVSGRAWWLGIAAAAALALIVLVPWQEPGGPNSDSAWRDAEPTGLRSLVPDEAAARESCILRWGGLDGVESFDVVVSAPNLEVVATAEALRVAEFQVPEAALIQFEPGTRLLWQVTARMPDGRRLVSETFFIRLQ